MNAKVNIDPQDQASLMAEFEAWQNGKAGAQIEEPSLDRGMSMGINGQRPQRLPRVPPVPVRPPDPEPAPVLRMPQPQYVPPQGDDLADREYYLLSLVEQHGYTIQGHSANRLTRVITLVLEY